MEEVKPPDVSVTIEPTTEFAQPTADQTHTPLAILSYSQWSIEELQAREQLLTAQIQKQSLLISESESDDISFLLTQKKVYSRLSSVLSLISKIIGATGPIALVITTTLSAPSFSNYVIAGITGTAVPLYHFSEQMRILSVNYEKQAITAYNNDVIDLQKVKAARKAQQQEIILKRQIRRVKKKSVH
jgi:hypothetical protein